MTENSFYSCYSCKKCNIYIEMYREGAVTCGNCKEYMEELPYAHDYFKNNKGGNQNGNVI